MKKALPFYKRQRSESCGRAVALASVAKKTEGLNAQAITQE